MGYYSDEKKQIIREDLLDSEAQRIARTFIVMDKKNPTQVDQGQSLTSSQLRRFYNELKQLEKKSKMRGFNKVCPLIKMIKSKASYAANPTNQKKMKAEFKDFLVNSVNQINDEKDFEAFMLHFEAVVGFFYGMGIKNN